MLRCVCAVIVWYSIKGVADRIYKRTFLLGAGVLVATPRGRQCKGSFCVRYPNRNVFHVLDTTVFSFFSKSTPNNGRGHDAPLPKDRNALTRVHTGSPWVITCFSDSADHTAHAPRTFGVMPSINKPGRVDSHPQDLTGHTAHIQDKIIHYNP